MQKITKHKIIQLITLVAITCCSFNAAIASSFNNQEALSGVVSGKALFDINISSPKKIGLYLSVIKQTHQDLVNQDLQPEFIIAFRGPSVRLISSDVRTFEKEDQELLKQAGKLLAELASMGVKIEACSIATTLFKVNNESLHPGVNVVGNTFVSLIGYQSKGFALIPIQ